MKVRAHPETSTAPFQMNVSWMYTEPVLGLVSRHIEYQSTHAPNGKVYTSHTYVPWETRSKAIRYSVKLKRYEAMQEEHTADLWIQLIKMHHVRIRRNLGSHQSSKQPKNRRDDPSCIQLM